MSISAEELQAELDRVAESQRQAERDAMPNDPTGYGFSKIVEPALAVAGGLAGDIVGGYAGAGDALIRGNDSGVETLRSVQDFFRYEPHYRQGAEGLDALATAFEPVAKGMEWLQKQSGDAAFEATGSPTAGAAGTIVPDVALELTGLGLLRKIMPRAKFFDAKGNPTDDLYSGLRELGIEYDDLSPEAKALIPPQAAAQIGAPKTASQTALVPAAAKQTETGGEGALAPYRPQVSRGIRQDSLSPYPEARTAAELMDDPALIQLIKTATPETRAAMLEMLNIRRRTADNKRVAQTQRSTDVSGGAAVERIEYLSEIASQNRKRLDEIANKELAGKNVNVQPVADAYSEVLDKAKIEIDPETGKFDYENSIFKPVDQAQYILDKMNDVLSKDTVDAAELHVMKRQLDELIGATKGKPGATGDAGAILARMRSEINEVIRGINPEYAAVNDELSQTLTVFDDLDSVTGSRVDIFDANADAKIGQELRKLFSNYGVRTDMSDAIRQLEDVARAQGATFQTSAGDLAQLATSLNKRIGAEAENSMQGIVQSATDNPGAAILADVMAESATGTPGLASGIRRVLKRRGQVSNTEILNALEALIKDLGTGG